MKHCLTEKQNDCLQIKPGSPTGGGRFREVVVARRELTVVTLAGVRDHPYSNDYLALP